MTTSITISPLPNLSPHQITNAASQMRASLDCSTCSGQEAQLWGTDGFSFEDVLDVVNPLQQLPVVSSIYRGVTGDSISTGAKLIGGALMGGPAGFLMAALGSAFESITGGDIGSHLAAAISPNDAAQKYAAAKKLG